MTFCWCLMCFLDLIFLNTLRRFCVTLLYFVFPLPQLQYAWWLFGTIIEACNCLAWWAVTLWWVSTVKSSHSSNDRESLRGVQYFLTCDEFRRCCFPVPQISVMVRGSLQNPLEYLFRFRWVISARSPTYRSRGVAWHFSSVYFFAFSFGLVSARRM